jgi:hypothetical protein
LVGELSFGRFTVAVVLRPESMSETIVLVVPLGPMPCLTKRELMRGTEMLALRLVAVVVGLGDTIWMALYLL